VRRIVLAVLLVAAAAAAAIAANLALLGYASARHDPVGKLTPRLQLNVPAAPADVVRPEHGRIDNSERDADD
jgi:hypothetical protein